MWFRSTDRPGRPDGRGPLLILSRLAPDCILAPDAGSAGADGGAAASIDGCVDACVYAKGGAEFGFPLLHAFPDGAGEVEQAVGEPPYGPVEALGAQIGLRLRDLAKGDDADGYADSHPDDS